MVATLKRLRRPALLVFGSAAIFSLVALTIMLVGLVVKGAMTDPDLGPVFAFNMLYMNRLVFAAYAAFYGLTLVVGAVLLLGRTSSLASKYLVGAAVLSAVCLFLNVVIYEPASTPTPVWAWAATAVMISLPWPIARLLDRSTDAATKVVLP